MIIWEATVAAVAGQASELYLRMKVHFFVCIWKWKDTGYV